MAIYAAFRFEGGQDGAAIAAGVAAAGDRPWDAVVDGAATYSAEHARGGLAARLDTGTAGAGRVQLQWIDAAATDATCWTRLYLWADAAPPSNARIVHYADAVGTMAFALQHRSNGVLRLLDQNTANMATGSFVIPTGQWVRIECMVVPSPTAGAAVARIYATDPDGDTPDETIVTGASYNTLSGFGFWRFGPTGTGVQYVDYMDDLAISFDDWIGPAAAAEVHGDLAVDAAAAWSAEGRKRAGGPAELQTTAGVAAAGHKQTAGPLTGGAAVDLAAAGRKRAHGRLAVGAEADMTAVGTGPGNKLVIAGTAALQADGHRTGVGFAELGAAAEVTRAGHKETEGGGTLPALAVTQMTGRKRVHGSFAAVVTAEVGGEGGPAPERTMSVAAAAALGFTGHKTVVPVVVEPPSAAPKPSVDWSRRGVTYRYEFADALTDATLAVLPLVGVKIDRRICQAGALQGTIPVPNEQLAAQVQRVIPRDDTTISTGPGRVICHVYRNESIWGSYMVWSGTPKGDERGRVTVPIQGATLESYLEHREIRRDIEIVQADQLEIARYLVAHMQALGADSSMGIEVGGEEMSGILRDRTYKGSEAATYGQRLTELSQVIDGPEWMIRTWVDPATGRRRREFIVAGQLGADAPGQVWMQPGNVISWEYPADATNAATSWQTRGDTIQDDVSEDSEPLVSNLWESPRWREAGWPLLEKTVDYQGVTEVDTLDAYAAWWAVNRSGVMRIPQATVRLPANTSFHPNNLGGTDTFKLENVWFPKGTFSRSWRVIGVEVTPVSREDGQEQIKLVFEEPSDDAAQERDDSETTVLTTPGGGF